MTERGIEEETFAPRYNTYQCASCGKKYLSVDLARGVTPMFMTCFRSEGCQGPAISMGYPVQQQLLGVPLLIEWVKPDAEELERVKNPALLHHFANGGLMRRAVATAPDWVKSLV